MVDDHALLRLDLKTLIDEQVDMEVVGEGELDHRCASNGGQHPSASRVDGYRFARGQRAGGCPPDRHPISGDHI